MAATMSSIRAAPLAQCRPCAPARQSFGNIAGLAPVRSSRTARRSLAVRAEKSQVIQPLNGDPFIGMLETPVTSSPLVASYLSALPAYRTGVSPLLRGVEIGLAHGLFVTGPFIKLGPLRNVPEVAEKAGVLAGAGLVAILGVCLSIYGQVTFAQDTPSLGVKTLSGRDIQKDPLQSAEGWSNFTAGWVVGGLSGAAFSYVLTQTLPYYY